MVSFEAVLLGIYSSVISYVCAVFSLLQKISVSNTFDLKAVLFDMIMVNLLKLTMQKITYLMLYSFCLLLLFPRASLVCTYSWGILFVQSDNS